MPKIVFIGAGSTVFAKNLIGDILLTPPLRDSSIALYDIDGKRLEDSRKMAENLNRTINGGRARITAHLGPGERKKALRNADFAVCTVQVGGYRPSTVIDFEIPKKYGLRQTIGDTLGIGGIFRALRTIPAVLEIARDMEEVCPEAWFLNYTNPMVMVTGALLRASAIKTVGLCHSVQACVPKLLRDLGLADSVRNPVWKIAGINHMAWLLELGDGGRDLYPEVRRRALEKNAAARRPGGVKHDDMVRYEIMRHFGYYVTESSEHSAEYTPYWIKAAYPDLIEEFNIPLDEYLRRCETQIAEWEKRRDELVENRGLSHERTFEYGADIIEAVVTGRPCSIHGNVLNTGLIPNLPAEAIVEVPCLVDSRGVQGVYSGSLPPQCAALNTTNINVQLLTIEAALTGDRDLVYQAAYLDPHTAAELPLDDIRRLCDDMFAAHQKSAVV
jgi:alpha-galactosidase